MTVLEMLPEVIGSVEFLGLIALAEFVDDTQVVAASMPLWRIREDFATESADIRRVTADQRRMESMLDAGQNCAGP